MALELEFFFIPGGGGGNIFFFLEPVGIAFSLLPQYSPSLLPSSLFPFALSSPVSIPLSGTYPPSLQSQWQDITSLRQDINFLSISKSHGTYLIIMDRKSSYPLSVIGYSSINHESIEGFYSVYLFDVELWRSKCLEAYRLTVVVGSIGN